MRANKSQFNSIQRFSLLKLFFYIQPKKLEKLKFGGGESEVALVTIENQIQF